MDHSSRASPSEENAADRRAPRLGLAAGGVLALCLLGASRAGGEGKKLILFHAGSLSAPLREISALFERRHPGLLVEAEAAGSRDSARKISDLGRACDVLAVADFRVADELLVPRHAEFNIRFAGNEMAIAYSPRSRHADLATPESWPELLLRDDVAFGRADPNRDPCGYRTEMVFQLAEKHLKKPGLAQRLLAKDGRFIRPKETDLLALLEVGEIDYLFIYRSVIRQHELKMIPLPDEINLRSPRKARLYSEARVRVTGAKAGEVSILKGEPIVYSVTIPRGAPHQAEAEAYVSVLLSPEGQAILRANGQEPLRPPVVDHPEKLPASLRKLARKGR